MPSSLPKAVSKYFWGDDLQELNWPVHKKYISKTLLDKGDLPSVKWLLNQVSGQEILDLLPSLKLSPKSRNFWQIYLS